jgi:hypothetical protein
LKKFDLGQTISIVANLGVIAGIVFLGYEIQQNNTLMRAQTRSDIARDITGLLLTHAHSPYLEEIFVPELELFGGDAGLLRRNLMSGATFRMWENMHYQHRIGLYDDSEFRYETEAWRVALAMELTRSHWCAIRSRYSPDFVETVAAMLDRPCEN